jgi:capsular exopolysaccharide synthesis family protein
MQPNDPSNKPLALPRNGAQSPPSVASLILPGAPSGFASPDKPTGPPALSAAPTPATLLAAVRRRWKTAVALGLVGAAAAVALAVVLVPGQYSATALLKVSARSPTLELVAGGGEPAADPTVTRGNQEPIIKSLPVLNAALNDEQVRALPVVREQVSPTAWLAKAVKVDFKGPEILQLSMSGQEPAELQLLVNAVARAYVAYTDDQEKIRRQALLEQMRVNYKEEEASLREKQRVLQRTLDLNKMDDPETAKEKYTSKLRQLEEALKTVRDLSLKEIETRSELSEQKKLLEALPQAGLPDLTVEKYLQDDPLYKQQRTNLEKLDEETRNVRLSFNPTAAQPRLDEINRQKQGLQKEMAEYRQQQMPRLLDLFRAEAASTIGKLERELEGVHKRQEYLRGEVERLDAETKRLSPAEQRAASSSVAALRQEAAMQEEALKKLGDRLETFKLAPALGSQVTLLQPAELPQVLDRGRQIKAAGGAGVGAFLLLLFGVAFWEFRTRKISAARDVVDGLGLSVVGTLPALPARARRPGTALVSKSDQYYQGLLSESVDAIRTLLLHAARTDDLQVVMVTSAGSGEGKTSVASHLAASLARAWRKTLLIDGDLRHPALHQLFNQPAGPGFSEVLRGEMGLHDAVRPTTVSRLWMMPAGHWDSHAVQALAQEGVRSMFAQLKEQYDFVVVDSCPLLPVADSLLLAQHVDGVLFSVLRDVSRAPAIHAAQQRLASLGVRTLGAVVIGTGTEAGGASYVYQAQARA